MLNGFHQLCAGSECKSDPVLNVLRLPGRVNAEQTAALLGMEEWDVPLLVKAGLLKPLGSVGAVNRVKYFASVVVERCARDPKWLHRATEAISRCRTVGKNRASRLREPTTAKSSTPRSATASSSVRPSPSTAHSCEPARTLTETLQVKEGQV